MSDNRPAGWSPYQHTLAHAVALAGRGLHGGRWTRVRICPAPPGHGVVFCRMRRGCQTGRVPAALAAHVALPLCSGLQADDMQVRSVEHLLAALLALDITNARIELEGEEVPALDGGASDWVAALAAAGRMGQCAPRRLFRVLSPLTVYDGPRRLAIEPATQWSLDVRVSQRGVGAQRWQGVVRPDVFATELAAARGYGQAGRLLGAMVSGYLRGKPALRGAHPGRIATIVGGKVIGGLRLPDEFARHRAVDLIGDFALLGAPVLGRIVAVRPNHALHLALLRTLLATPGAWEWVDGRQLRNEAAAGAYRQVTR